MQIGNRHLRAIMVELRMKQFTAVVVWPDDEPKEGCCKLKSVESWLRTNY
jgi:hypothetical protein